MMNWKSFLPAFLLFGLLIVLLNMGRVMVFEKSLASVWASPWRFFGTSAFMAGLLAAVFSFIKNELQKE